MELYLLRHGIAEDVAAGGRDADRALTAEGRKRLREMLKVAQKAGVRPSLIVSSPYRRALETASIAAKGLEYDGDILESSALVPMNQPQGLWDEVKVHKNEASIVLVAHEPLLSSAAGFLLNANSLRVDFKKGALMRIDIDGFGPQPQGLLKWYLTGRLLA